jgi:excisionase family DNA binding protein
MVRAAESELLSIGKAAERFNVSRRTVERWVREGKLTAEPSKRDRRVRLVDPADVERLTASRSPMSTGGEPAPEHQPGAVDHVQGDGGVPDEVDVGLGMLYSYHHRLISRLSPAAFEPLTVEQLRQGPVGQDLLRLGRIARGEIREPRVRVLETIDSILQLLFWPPATDDYRVPREFWDTELGQLLIRAKYRVYRPSELVSIGEAAQLLGVTRPMVYMWMDDRTLNYVRDDESGRTFVLREDIVNLKRVAERMAALPRAGD